MDLEHLQSLGLHHAASESIVLRKLGPQRAAPELQWRGKQEELVVAIDTEAAEAAAARLLAELDGGVMGLDTEWSKAREVAVLQLAGRRTCLVCLLPEVEVQACPSLQQLLADRNIVKAGIGIGQDVEMLRKCGLEVNGFLDLFLLAVREQLVGAAQPCGLAYLSRVLLQEELPKHEWLRRSDWAMRPLSPEHLVYAAKDALAGRDAALEMWLHGTSSMRIEQRPTLVTWCGELLDRTPKFKASPGNKPAKQEGEHFLGCEAYAGVKKFGQRRIVDKDGQLLLHMREKTCEALLRRGLACLSRDENGDEVVQLGFSPGDNYEYAGLDVAQRNACVGCGADGVARFYVVPHIFWAHLPAKCKSYNCHDILMLCPRCRRKAELPQAARVQQLLAEHGARKAGDSFANENSLSPGQSAAKKLAGSLLSHAGRGRKGSMPEDQVLQKREAVAMELGVQVEALTKDHLERAFRLGEGPRPSARICQSACADGTSLRSFLRMWREFFVASLQPQFLAEGWGVETGLDDGRFVPSVAHVVEWPGDWFCGSCGVHCFGRNALCRACGTTRQEEELPSKG